MKSIRLTTCLEYTKGFHKLIDVGTDHGYIPIEAIKKNYVNYAVASDNKIGPFNIAKSNISNNNLANVIEVTLANGLDKLDYLTDVLLIAGMGGVLISEILNHDLRNLKRVIIQANNEMSKVRQIMNQKSWSIIDETIIYEHEKFYEISVFEPGKEVLLQNDFIFGPKNLEIKSNVFYLKYQKELNSLISIIDKIKNNDDKTLKIERMKKLEEILNASTSNCQDN